MDLAGGEQVHQSLPGKMFNLLSALGVPVKEPLTVVDYYLLPHPTPWPRNRKPYIVTIHDVAYLERPYYYSWRQRWWHLAIHTRQLLERSAGLICVSEATKQRLLHIYPQLDNKPLMVSGEGISVTELSADNQSALQLRLRLPARYLLFLGTIEPRKNIASIIRALDIIRISNPDIVLVVAGKYGWLAKSVRRTIEQHSHIRWLHYVTPEEKSYLMQQAQALVWPSWYEGFGFPPLEATHWGTPVITSWSTALPELMGKQAIYCNPYNYLELADVIQQVLINNSCRTTAIDQVSWGTVADRTLAFIQSLHENRH